MTYPDAVTKLRSICPEASFRLIEQCHRFYGPGGGGPMEQEKFMVYVSSLGYFYGASWEECFEALEQKLADIAEAQRVMGMGGEK